MIARHAIGRALKRKIPAQVPVECKSETVPLEDEEGSECSKINLKRTTMYINAKHSELYNSSHDMFSTYVHINIDSLCLWT